MRHAVYLPTHRAAVPAISDAALDAKSIGEVADRSAVLVVVEHHDGAWVRDHSRALTQATDENGLQAVHLTVDRAGRLLDDIIQQAGLRTRAAWLHGLLLPSGVAYGAGPNKMALLAAALGIDALHRRDSDVRLDRRGDVLLCPGALEAQVIGRPAASIDGLTTKSTAPVRIVASSYFGDPPLDRRDVFRAGWRFARGAEALLAPTRTDGELDDHLVEYFLKEPATRYDSDFYELDTTGRIDMGVACTLGMHKQLPEMPALATIGCDYAQRSLCSQLGAPVLFHSRKVEHRYGGDRTGAGRETYAVAYGMAELRLILLWRVWQVHIDKIRAAPRAYGDVYGNVHQDAYAESFRQALEATASSLRALIDRHQQLHRQAAEVAPPAERARLTAIVDAVNREAPRIVQSVTESIVDFTELVLVWPRLIEAAAAIGGDVVS